jgi:NADH ubiquinone oxidoreductase, 20 Kd subunit
MAKEIGSQSPTIEQHLKQCGVSRRSFLQLCAALMVTAPVGLGLTSKATAQEIAKIVGKARRPSVIWLHFQDGTGCSETLLRTSRPDVADLILNVISLDYHETLMAASGCQAEAARKQAVAENFGKFVLVVEGSIPTKEQGRYMKLAGRPAIDVLKDVGRKSAAVVAMGSCAAWGGVPSADPNPTGAQSADVEVLPCHQLTPELAETISRADTVLFIDCAKDGVPGEFHCQEIHWQTGSISFTHDLPPSALLDLASQLFGSCPRAFLLTICGECFATGKPCLLHSTARFQS